MSAKGTKFTTTLKVSKASKKIARQVAPLPNPSPKTGDPYLDKFLQDVRNQLNIIASQLNAAEQRLNHMDADPVTGAVTFTP